MERERERESERERERERDYIERLFLARHVHALLVVELVMRFQMKSMSDQTGVQGRDTREREREREKERDRASMHVRTCKLN